ncbi:MAG: hypothetical protein ACLRMJ_11220 [Alistipes finegoldii]
MFRATTGLQEELAGEVEICRRLPDDLATEDVTYDLGRIDLGSDVVDMLADNLDPKARQIPETRWTSTAKSSAHCLSACSSAPVLPHGGGIRHTCRTQRKTKIGETRLHENDLRQIIDGTEIILPSSWRNISPAPDSRPISKSSSPCA